MKIALTAQIRALTLRREEEALIAGVQLAGECEGSVLNTLGVSKLQNGFWLLDTGCLLYSGITEVRLSQRFTNVSVRFAEQPLWHGVALKKLAFTPLEQYRIRLGLSLCGRIEHRLLQLFAERLRGEIAVVIERADLLEESRPVARIRRRAGVSVEITRGSRTHAERTQPQ